MKMSRVLPALIAAVAIAGITPESQATVFNYFANCNGPAEAPPNASPGTGYAVVIYDDVARTLDVSVSFGGLLGNTTVSHIHSATAVPGVGTAGVATPTPTFPGFPAGVKMGTYSNVLDLTLASSYNPAFMAANGGTPASAEAALAAGIAAGRAYWNIHSNLFPGGEIRGFLQPLPEPGSLALLGLATLMIRRRR